MKKCYILSICLLALIFSAQSQTNKKGMFGIGVNAGFPTAQSSFSFVAGVDLQGEINAAQSLNVTGSLGYESYFIKSVYQSALGQKTAGLIPILAGLKYKFTPALYGHAQVGYSISTQSGGSGSFTYAPSLGYILSPKTDLSVKFLGLKGGSDAIFLRLAFNFK